MANTHFTNRILTEMKTHGVSEAEVMDTFNNGTVEWIVKGKNGKSIRYYSHREVGVMYAMNENGDWILTHLWTRKTG